MVAFGPGVVAGMVVVVEGEVVVRFAPSEELDGGTGSPPGGMQGRIEMALCLQEYWNPWNNAIARQYVIAGGSVQKKQSISYENADMRSWIFKQERIRTGLSSCGE